MSAKKLTIPMSQDKSEGKFCYVLLSHLLEAPLRSNRASRDSVPPPTSIRKTSPKQHAHVGAGFVQCAPKPILGKRDDLGRVQRHANVNQKWDGGKPRHQADQQQGSANNLDDTDKWSHDLRPRNADLHKTSNSQ